MLARHCLDCAVVIPSGSRCTACQRAVEARRQRRAVQRRGRDWPAISRALLAQWRAEGRGCAHAHLGGCSGPLTVDHVIPGSRMGGYQPLCRRHNSMKGTRMPTYRQERLIG